MPKNHKKKMKISRPNQSNDDDKSDDNNFDENASTISNVSSAMTYQDLENVVEENKNKDNELENLIDNLDVQLNNSLDALQQKGFKEREDALKLLNKLFSNKYISDHLLDKRFTLTDSIGRCLKKGKLSEQLLAAQLAMLTFIQFGYSDEGEAFLREIKETLVATIKNDKSEPEIRGACAKVLGLAMFINDTTSEASEAMNLFETLYSTSYMKGDGTLRQHPQNIYQLHIASLSSWCLLLSIMPLSFASEIITKYISKFQDFLQSPDVDLRIVAGETIALMYEIGNCDAHSDLASYDNTNLIQQLENLIRESGKSKSKRDKRHQHSSFRDILRTIEEGELPDVETIKFGSEELILDNWIIKRHYKTFKDVLGTGMNPHLQENDLLRDIFDLGAPVQSMGANQKGNSKGISKLQKAQMNKEQFRSRTKNMNKKRENKRNDVEQSIDTSNDD